MPGVAASRDALSSNASVALVLRERRCAALRQRPALRRASKPALPDHGSSHGHGIAKRQATMPSIAAFDKTKSNDSAADLTLTGGTR